MAGSMTCSAILAGAKLEHANLIPTNSDFSDLHGMQRLGFESA